MLPGPSTQGQAHGGQDELDHPARARLVSQMRIRRARDPDDGAAGAHHRERSGGGVPTLGVEDEVHRVSGEARHEVVGAVVDHLVGAQPAHELRIPGSSCRDHARAEVLGELDGHRPDAAGSAMDQHPLPRLQVPDLDERLPCGQCNHRQRRCLHRVSGGRRQGHRIGVDRNNLAERAHPHHSGVAVDLVPDGELRHLLTDRDHLTGQFPAHHLGQVEPEHCLELSCAGALIGVVHARRDHAHQHLPRPRGRLGHRHLPHRVAVLLQDECLHALLLAASPSSFSL